MVQTDLVISAFRMVLPPKPAVFFYPPKNVALSEVNYDREVS
jgi:hypothetical protein